MESCTRVVELESAMRTRQIADQRHKTVDLLFAEFFVGGGE